MTNINSLYRLFGVLPDCSDNELRQAYHRLMRQYHPDRNPHQIAIATEKTQQIASAYADLKNYRKKPEKASRVNISFNFKIGPTDEEIVQDIHRRKEAFRQAWESFHQEPKDVIKALKLIHVAFEADWQDTVHNLLLSPILIDSASLLMFSVKGEPAYQTIKKWVQILYSQEQRFEEAIQILEDTVALGNADIIMRSNLVAMHTNFALGYASGKKPSPLARIEHLNRVIELQKQGPKAYINPDVYINLAEAYQELGDNTQAREKLECLLELISDDSKRNAKLYKLLGKGYFELGDFARARNYLEQAKKIDPTLWGVMPLARSLRLSPGRTQKPRIEKRKVAHKYTELEQVPSISQIREWELNEKWDEILAFANPSDYHCRIFKEKFYYKKNLFRQIASSLGKCPDERAIEALNNLFSIKSGQMRRLCVLSLSKVGNQHTIHQLKNLDLPNETQKFVVRNAISYLQARLSTNQFNGSSDKLFKLAKQTIAKDNYGKARFLLEKVVQDFERRYKTRLLPQNSVSQNLSSQKHAQNSSSDETNFSRKVDQAIQHSIQTIIPKSSQPTFFETLILLAEACQKMEDYRTVVSIIKPVFAEVPLKYRDQMSKLLLSSLWSGLLFEPYDPIDDEDYLFALNLELDVILQANVPHVILYRTKELARWMGELGRLEMERWIRSLIRAEAPGTNYVERIGNGYNSPKIELSYYLNEQLTLIDNRIKSLIPDKLSKVLKSPGSLSDDSHHSTKLLQ